MPEAGQETTVTSVRLGLAELWRTPDGLPSGPPAEDLARAAEADARTMKWRTI